MADHRQNVTAPENRLRRFAGDKFKHDYGLRRKGEHCHAFCALRVDAFPTGGDFCELMDAMVERLHAEPTVEAVPPIRYPGERGKRTYRERSANGIPLRQHVLDDLRALGGELGLPREDLWRG